MNCRLPREMLGTEDFELVNKPPGLLSKFICRLSTIERGNSAWRYSHTSHFLLTLRRVAGTYEQVMQV
jgi:hypothetical protein